MSEDGDSGAPDPPASLPKYLREGATKQDAATLRELAAYATALADWKEADAATALDDAAVDDDETPSEYDDAEWEDALDSTGAPPRATITVKEINGNRYYYYQWRDGDAIKSEYIAPVSPSR